jgi:hypothetical protein
VWELEDVEGEPEGEAELVKLDGGVNARNLFGLVMLQDKERGSKRVVTKD